jgi:hypothetical protein
MNFSKNTIMGLRGCNGVGRLIGIRARNTLSGISKLHNGTRRFGKQLGCEKLGAKVRLSNGFGVEN